MEPFVLGVIASEIVALFVLAVISQGIELENFGIACTMFAALWLCTVLVTSVFITGTDRTTAWPAGAMIMVIGHLMVSIIAYRHENRFQLPDDPQVVVE